MRHDMTTRQAAEYLGYRPHTLECWRWERRGPAFLKLPSGGVRYCRAELDEWARSGQWVAA